MNDSTVDIRLAAIAQKEDSFLLYDRPEFLANISNFSQAFGEIDTELALSVKTNYLPTLLIDAYRAGLRMEVVSLMEYEMVRALGTEPPRIIVNGPGKSARLLERSWEEGATVQLDAPGEIETLHRIAPRMGHRPLRCALRINVSPDAGGFSRFGFDADAADFASHVNFLCSIKGIELAGLHAHACSATRSAEDYAALTEKVLSVASQFSSLEYINLGGGFLSPAPLELREQFPFPWTDFEGYGRAIGAVWRRHFAQKTPPKLVFEPGLAIEATAMRFFTRVLEVRRLAGREVVNVAGTCYDIKPSKHRRNPPMRRWARGQAPSTHCHAAMVAGNTCMEDDILFHNYTGEIASGDFLIFTHAGAYAQTLRPLFISPRPPIFLNDPQSGSCECISPVEDWRRLFPQGSPAT